MREIKEIILHCSATKERSNFKLNDIEGWHKQKLVQQPNNLTT